MTPTPPTDIKKYVSQCIGEQPEASLLLQYLIAIQHQFLYVPQSAIKLLSKKLAIGQSHIKSVIDFYSFLNLKSPGRYQLLFSDNITDRFGGNVEYYGQMRKAMRGEDVSIGFTSCTGLCDQGPGLLVNGLAIKHLDKTRVDAIAVYIRSQIPVNKWPRDWFEIENNIQRKDIQLASEYVAGQALQKVITQDESSILQQLEHSG
jgi:[NiFe] hydrogenase diaphorase moiety large subunit